MFKETELQRQLVQAIRDQAEPETIQELLSTGATPNDSEVTQALEEVADQAPEARTRAVALLPGFPEALAQRKAADQAVFDLMEAIEENDVAVVSQALNDLCAVGDDANVDMGEGSLLALAVTCRSDVAIIELLLNVGSADINDFSRDAIEVLRTVEEGTWKAEVEKLFGIRANW